jgi:hypothetical protein
VYLENEFVIDTFELAALPVVGLKEGLTKNFGRALSSLVLGAVSGSAGHCRWDHMHELLALGHRLGRPLLVHAFRLRPDC